MTVALPAAVQTDALPSVAQPQVVAIGIVYFVVVAAIGVWATRRTRTAEDFFVAGHGIGLLALTLVLETLAFAGVWSFPAGVTASAVSLVVSMAVFLGVSVATRVPAGADEIDPDIRLIMDA